MLSTAKAFPIGQFLNSGESIVSPSKATEHARPSFFHHLHPPTIPSAQARWRYTLGAGGLSVYLLVVLLVTGAFEMFYYVATPEGAPLSVQTLTFLVPFGHLIRQLHFWSAQALVVVAGLHLLRVIMTGAYAPPRRFNYLLGLSLFVLILLLDWSGYVLRWDEGVQWAVMVGTNMLKTIPVIGQWLYRVIVGGDSPSATTLTRFYAAHIFTLIVLVIGFLVWHIFRVRRDGGIAAPPTAHGAAQRLSRNVLVRREAVMLIGATAVLLLIAAFLPAPIAPAMKTAGFTSGDSYAPWFFLWIQGLVRLGDPFWMGIVIPIGLLLFVALIPFVFPPPPIEQRGRWFPRGGRRVQILVSVCVLLIIGLTIWTLLV
ncbi:MAG TPA: cytochrome b N-terminal domain-containing protein [Anaerolineae bacterium]|nr:cytochrome b N-terminal domain-containing protein [Anaerolineae bacterium]